MSTVTLNAVDSMRFHDQLVVDDEEMEDFLRFRCSREQAAELCEHFLECDDCNSRLEFNRIFLESLTASFVPKPRVIPGGTETGPDSLLFDSTAFYICPDGLKRLQLVATATPAELSAATRHLGVFDEAARRALQVVTKHDVNQRQLAEVVSEDPVLATLMIQFANSPLFGALRAITTLPHAISFVGVEPARQLVLGAVMRRLLGQHHDQWAHAVGVAQSAEAIVSLTESIDPALAFLAGLVHDIGRLIFDRLPAEKLAVVRQLHARGCPLGRAEALLLGSNHTEAGALYLNTCRFDDSIVEAVREHHAPDRSLSPLAGALFLAEHLSGTAEDSVSTELVETACSHVGILPGDLDDLQPKRWAELLLAA